MTERGEAKDRDALALTQLRGIALVASKKAPTPAQVEAIEKMAQDAISILEERDPVKQRLAFVVLAFKQSLEMKHPVIRGKRMTRVTILDQTLFHWAVEQILSEEFMSYLGVRHVPA